MISCWSYHTSFWHELKSEYPWHARVQSQMQKSECKCYNDVLWDESWYDITNQNYTLVHPPIARESSVSIASNINTEKGVAHLQQEAFGALVSLACVRNLSQKVLRIWKIKLRERANLYSSNMVAHFGMIHYGVRRIEKVNLAWHPEGTKKYGLF